MALEASWVDVQRHGQDLVDCLMQGFLGLLLHAHPAELPLWSLPTLLSPKLAMPFEIKFPVAPFVDGVCHGGVDLPAAVVSSLVEIGPTSASVGAVHSSWSVHRDWPPATPGFHARRPPGEQGFLPTVTAIYTAVTVLTAVER
jgi:hypothetical protein